jgi:hypothetical protein
MRDFANTEQLWYPTWPSNVDDRALVVYVPLLVLSLILLAHHVADNRDYVKMWKHC